MNVLLIRIKPHKETIGLQHVMICEPLELEYLVSNHQTTAQVKIIDMIVEKRKLNNILKQENPDLVVFSGYISHVNEIKKAAQVVKNLNSKTKVLVGGVHAEVNPQDYVSDYIDYISCANGIDTFKDLMQRLINKESDLIETIPGLYKEGRTYTKHTNFKYNHPDRTSVSQYRSAYYYMFHNPCALIKTSFGCPYVCEFCFCREITDDAYYQRSIDDVINELKQIPEKEIYIVDDNFLYDKDRLLEFISKLKEHRLDKHFLVYGRADFVATNEDVIKQFNQVGLRAVIVGLESHKDDALEAYNKHSSKAINEKAVSILQSYDIEVYGTLIIPMDFKKEDFKGLENWLNEMRLTFVNLQPLTPLKGTAIYQDYKRHFIIPEDAYEKWDLAHVVLKPKYLSIRAYYYYLLVTYYRVVMRPHKVWRLIKKYGLKENIKMMIGSSRVSLQYMLKIWRG